LAALGNYKSNVEMESDDTKQNNTNDFCCVYFDDAEYHCFCVQSKRNANRTSSHYRTHILGGNNYPHNHENKTFFTVIAKKLMSET
jgi:hypothetical protein